MDAELQALFNKQLNRELYSAYLYLSMSAYFEHKGLPGFAHWMRVQAREELEHAMWFYNHLVERGGRVRLEPIEAPPAEWESVTQAVRHALEHERSVTKSIHELLDAARRLGDKAAEVFLYKLVEEQVEEEKLFSDLLQKLELAGESPQALLFLDAKLAERKG